MGWWETSVSWYPTYQTLPNPTGRKKIFCLSLQNQETLGGSQTHDDDIDHPPPPPPSHTHRGNIISMFQVISSNRHCSGSKIMDKDQELFD